MNYDLLVRGFSDEHLDEYVEAVLKFWRETGEPRSDTETLLREYVRRHRTSKGRDRRGNI